MKKHKPFDLRQANRQALQAYQNQLSRNMSKNNLSVLICFFEGLLEGRFVENKKSYPKVELARFAVELKEAGSCELLASKVLKIVDGAGKESRLFALDEGRLLLVLRLEGDKMWGHVQYRAFGNEDPEFTRASIVLNEELDRLGALDPCVEVYFQ